ncbi:MAG: hypothetical protein ACK53Y_22275, partial [bacterium]
ATQTVREYSHADRLGESHALQLVQRSPSEIYTRDDRLRNDLDLYISTLYGERRQRSNLPGRPKGANPDGEQRNQLHSQRVHLQAGGG